MSNFDRDNNNNNQAGSGNFGRGGAGNFGGGQYDDSTGPKNTGVAGASPYVASGPYSDTNPDRTNEFGTTGHRDNIGGGVMGVDNSERFRNNDNDNFGSTGRGGAGNMATGAGYDTHAGGRTSDIDNNTSTNRGGFGNVGHTSEVTNIGSNEHDPTMSGGRPQGGFDDRDNDPTRTDLGRDRDYDRSDRVGHNRDEFSTRSNDNNDLGVGTGRNRDEYAAGNTTGTGYGSSGMGAGPRDDGFATSGHHTGAGKPAFDTSGHERRDVDNSNTGTGTTGKASIGDKIKGTLEHTAGKLAGDRDMQERGAARKTGDNY